MPCFEAHHGTTTEHLVLCHGNRFDIVLNGYFPKKPKDDQIKKQNPIIVTTLKITSDSPVVIRDLLDFLTTKYQVIPTSRILPGDKGNHFAYCQIFQETH